jgi:tetratricopeptide (TPR) repeat protein
MVGRVTMAEAGAGKPDYLDVLVVAAAPVDLRPALNLGVELAKLEDMVRRSAIPIRMRRVFPPTFAQLEKELSAPELERRRREPRVLHFLGHGEMDGLWFEKEDGSSERISTSRMVKLLKGSPVRLALLNACWSATDLVASLCDRLTKEGGIPAAIGHGKPVADVSAIEFAREFYRQLVLGKSVGVAKNVAANALAKRGKPGATEVELQGDATLLLADDLAGGERPPRVEDGMPLKGALPGAAFFAGRDHEFTEVAATLRDTEQVAYGLWGIGGIGKTALALELARRTAWRYPGGIAWGDARDIAPPTLAGMLQHALAELEPASTAPDAASGLLRLMKEAPILVVLDNLETLPPDDHPALARFLRKVPRNGSRVLVTARSDLKDFDDVPGTRSRTLTTGLDDYSGAHHAFHYARLKDVKALGDEYPRVAEGRVEGKCALVSRRLSGHPRMIELAVGIARHGWEELEKSLKTLSGDLEEQLGTLLKTGLDLVGPEGQALLAFLPFFGSGKFIKEEMEAVAGAATREGTASGEEAEPDTEEKAQEVSSQAVDRGLQQLERAGLMEFEQGRGLHTFHQTLLDHVGRQPALDSDRASSGLLTLLVFHAGYLRDHGEDDVAIDRCVENILSTLEIAWGLRQEESPLDGAIGFVVDRLGNYFEQRGLWRVGERWLERAIDLRRSSTPARDQAALSRELHQLAQLLYRRGEHAEARRLLRDSIAVLEELGDRRGGAASLYLLAMIEHDQGNPAEARRLLRDSIAVFEGLGDRRGRAASLHELATIEREQGDPAEARRLLRDSIAVDEELGDRRGRAASLYHLAIIEHDQGNPAEARRLWEQSIEITREIGNPDGTASILGLLAQLNAREGRFEEALSQAREMVRLLEGIALSKAAVARKILGGIESMAAGGAPARAAGPDVLEALLGMPPDQALANVDQALEQARADGQAKLEVMLLVVKTKKFWEAGNIEASDQALEEAGRAVEKIEGEQRRELEEFLARLKEQRARAGQAPSEAVRLHNEGVKKAEGGDSAGALECFQKSADLSRSEGDDRGLAFSLLGASQVSLMLGRAKEAGEKIREGLELATELGDEELLQAMRTVAAMAAAAERS